MSIKVASELVRLAKELVAAPSRVASSRYIITDLGRAQTLRPEDGSEDFDIPRFGVWDKRTGDVVETGNDLNKLMDKYDVSEGSIRKIGS